MSAEKTKKLPLPQMRSWLLKAINAIHQARVPDSVEGETYLRAVLQIVEQHDFEEVEIYLGGDQDERHDPWIVPQTSEEAQTMIDRVVGEAQFIESQLCDRNKTRVNGERLPSNDYHQWRKRAVAALFVKHKHLRFLKRYARRKSFSQEQHP